jgi:hypothetical protein
MYKNARAPVTRSPLLAPAEGDTRGPEGALLQAGSTMSNEAVTPALRQAHRRKLEILMCLVV